jgi:hypothetical protein
MMHCMAYHTLTEGHFDGKLLFLVKEMTKDNSGAMVISVTLQYPTAVGLHLCVSLR